MTTVLEYGDSKEKIKSVSKKIDQKIKSKGIDTEKYVGKIHLKSDPLDLQKQFRNEWE